MAQQAASLATHTEAVPPRYEYLLEIEQSGGARCHLAIDPGTHAPKPPAAAPFGGGAEVSEQAGPAPGRLVRRVALARRVVRCRSVSTSPPS